MTMATIQTNDGTILRSGTARKMREQVFSNKLPDDARVVLDPTTIPPRLHETGYAIWAYAAE